MTPEQPSQILSRNLDLLLSMKGLSRKEAAQEIGVPYKWLRQAVSQGIARPDRRNAAQFTPRDARLANRRSPIGWTHR